MLFALYYRDGAVLNLLRQATTHIEGKIVEIYILAPSNEAGNSVMRNIEVLGIFAFFKMYISNSMNYHVLISYLISYAFRMTIDSVNGEQ